MIAFVALHMCMYMYILLLFSTCFMLLFMPLNQQSGGTVPELWSVGRT